MGASILRWYFGASSAGGEDSAFATGARQGRITSVCTSADTSDLALASRIRTGDTSAFTALVESYLDDAVRFAASIVQHRETAEDVVQDVLSRLWQQRSRMPESGSLRAFVFTAIRNRALDTLKRQRVGERAQQILDAEARYGTSVPEKGATALEAEEGQVLLHRVHAMITSLPERQQTALALRYGQGFKIADIGDVLGVSPKAAEQLVFRALRTLREVFRAE